MTWLVIIVIILIVGYYWLKNSAIKQQRDNAEWMDNKVAEHKEYLENYHLEEYRKARDGKNMALNDRKATIDYMVRLETERQLLHLWSKHITTVMASDKYSLESRKNLYDTWYQRLSSEVSLLEAIKYVDFDSYGEEFAESYQTFKATLEAFNYNPDQEDADTEKRVAKYIKSHYKDEQIGKIAKKVGKVL